MESIDFRSLSERLRTELSRVYFWQKIVRILSIIVYLFVFCWMMFVLFGGYLVGYIGLENYSMVTQYIFPVFMGFIVLNFAFSRSLMKFQGQENDIMRMHYVCYVSIRSFFLLFATGPAYIIR